MCVASREIDMFDRLAMPFYCQQHCWHRRMSVISDPIAHLTSWVLYNQG